MTDVNSAFDDRAAGRAEVESPGDDCLLLRTNEASPYDDREGRSHNYTSYVTNHKKIRPGVKVVFDRRGPSGAVLIGSAVIGHISEEGGRRAWKRQAR